MKFTAEYKNQNTRSPAEWLGRMFGMEIFFTQTAGSIIWFGAQKD